MDSIAVGTRTLLLPSLIPSISSFETQLSPASAIRLQTTLREPVSLVSAFDLVADETGDLPRLCRAYREESGVMFLDSGGYETSRVRKYAAHSWDLAAFLAAAEPDLFDFAFSFDIFPDLPNQTWQEYRGGLEELLEQHETIPSDRLIPVVHIVDQSGAYRYSDHEIERLIIDVAENHSAPFVAVPERELGSGLAARVAIVRRITRALRDANCTTALHLLGCGNPMSFAAFVDAGVASCDGLEWCRTYCASDMRLYHYQHGDSIGGLLPPVSPQAEFLLDGMPYHTRTAVTNLNNFAAIARAIQHRTGSAIEIVEQAFGEPIRL